MKKNRIDWSVLIGDGRGMAFALGGRRNALPLAAAVWLLSAWAGAAQSASGPIDEVQRHAAKAGRQKDAVEEVFMKSQAAIKRLAKIGPPAIPEIQNVLTDPAKDWKVKAMMCEALGKIDDGGSAALLAQVLHDHGQDEFVRAVAGHALGTLGRPESTRIIEETISDRSVPVRIRARTMMALGASGFDDAEWLKRVADGEGLGFGKDERLSQEEGGIILNAQRALGTSKNPKAVDALIELQERYPANGILTDILKGRKDPRTIPVLLKVLTYKNPKGFTSDSMMVAAQALGEMKATQAVEPLIEVVKTDPNELFVADAATALARIGDKRAVPVLEKLVQDLPSDPRFNRGGDTYFKQEKAGWGPIPEIKKALEDLRKK